MSFDKKVSDQKTVFKKNDGKVRSQTKSSIAGHTKFRTPILVENRQTGIIIEYKDQTSAVKDYLKSNANFTDADFEKIKQFISELANIRSAVNKKTSWRGNRVSRVQFEKGDVLIKEEVIDYE